jgi:hypothetical protein
MRSKAAFGGRKAVRGFGPQASSGFLGYVRDRLFD